MIKATELRIGNYLMREDFLNPDKFHEAVAGAGDISACVVFPEKFRPIPIDDEWMKRLGFVDNRREDHVFQPHSGKYYIDRPEDRYLNPITRGVFYVHELQNLYFAITGDELI